MCAEKLCCFNKPFKVACPYISEGLSIFENTMEVLVDKDFIKLTNGGDTFTMAAMSQLAPQDTGPSQLLSNGLFRNRPALVDSISPGQFQT